MEDHEDLEMQLLHVHAGPDATVLGNTKAMEHTYKTAPLISGDAVGLLGPETVPQRALYGRILSQVVDGVTQRVRVPKLYINTNAPFSGVICGLQGSGKSHSTSIILESCLIKDGRLGALPKPLSAVVFHFDTAAGGGQPKPCEAAYLSTMDSSCGSASAPKVTVLVLPNNVSAMKEIYATLPHVEVKPLRFAQADLSGDRLLSMMRVDENNHMPLYMELIMTILRSMEVFDYEEFRDELRRHKLNPSQKAMLNLRLALLDSCLKDGNAYNSVSTQFHEGCLTIVDLTSSFMDSSSACGFFDIILGLFLESTIISGKVVVLDEAHKYLGDGGGSEKLTESLLTVIRQQRHLNTRIVVSTQEPTVVPPKFLELSSFIIAHRFSSPQWLRHLSSHIPVTKDLQEELFSKIIDLQTGQALVFAPSGLGTSDQNATKSSLNSWLAVEQGLGQLKSFGRGYLVVHSRQRVTRDGGQSMLASAAHVRIADKCNVPVDASSTVDDDRGPNRTPPGGLDGW